MDQDGLCLTAASPAPPPTPSPASKLVIGRTLSGDRTGGAAEAAAELTGGEVVRKAGFAVMFLNNGAEDAIMTCGQSCLQQLGLDSSTEYAVRDVWAHDNLQGIAAQSFSLSAKVPGGGGSFVARLTARGALVI